MPCQWASMLRSCWRRDVHGRSRSRRLPRMPSRTVAAGPTCGAPYPLWAGACWIMVKMLAVQIRASWVAAARSRCSVMPRQGGCGRHRWTAGAAGSRQKLVTSSATWQGLAGAAGGGGRAPRAGGTVGGGPGGGGAGGGGAGRGGGGGRGCGQRGPGLGLAPGPPYLAGREERVAGLDARLADSDGREPRVVVLDGLGGLHAGHYSVWSGCVTA